MKNLGFNRERRFLHDQIGFNYRMTNIQGAIGLAQLQKVEEYVALRRSHAATYTERLHELTLLDGAEGWLAIADADQLDQVLWALLDNAVKYGERSPVEVELAVDEAGGRLRITVADQGPGVRDADRSRLFGRFERGAQQSAEDGTGLGLYVSRELVRAMGGDLVLEPHDASRGAAFSVYLPAENPVES